MSVEIIFLLRVQVCASVPLISLPSSLLCDHSSRFMEKIKVLTFFNLHVFSFHTSSLSETADAIIQTCRLVSIQASLHVCRHHTLMSVLPDGKHLGRRRSSV
jgi:hypothetical protein